MKLIKNGVDDSTLSDVLAEIHRSFAMLSQEEQRFAKVFLGDIQSGNVQIEDGKSFRDYITEYQTRYQYDEIHLFADNLGMDENLLRQIFRDKSNYSDINSFGRLDACHAVVTTLVVYCVDFFAKKFCKCASCNCLPIAVNSIVLGCCLTKAANGYGFGLSLLCAFGAGIAYLVASFMVAGVRERVNEKFIPEAGKGAPILVMEMAIISRGLCILMKKNGYSRKSLSF